MKLAKFSNSKSTVINAVKAIAGADSDKYARVIESISGLDEVKEFKVKASFSVLSTILIKPSRINVFSWKFFFAPSLTPDSTIKLLESIGCSRDAFSDELGGISGINLSGSKDEPLDVSFNFYLMEANAN